MKEYLDGLVEARQRAWHEAKEILERAESEKREMSVDERAKFDAIEADLDAKDAEVRSIIERESRNAEADALREKAAGILTPAPKDTPKGPDVRAMFRGDAKGFDLSVDADLARSLFERRDITLGAGSAGKTVPAATMVGRLYEELVRNTALFGVSTIVTTASGEPLDFPVITATGGSTSAKIGASSQPGSEAAAIPEVDPVFNKVTITPSKYAALMQVSSELAQDTVVDLEGYLARSAAQGIRNKAGAALHANVASGAFTSSVNAANISSFTYDNLVDIQFAVTPEYRSKAIWYVHDTFVKNVRKLKDSQQRPLWEPSVQAGTPDTILGNAVASDPNVATTGASAKVAFFGDLSAHYIRQVGQVRFEVSDQYAFANDLITYRVIWRGGSAVLDTQAIAFATVTA